MSLAVVFHSWSTLEASADSHTGQTHVGETKLGALGLDVLVGLVHPSLLHSLHTHTHQHTHERWRHNDDLTALILRLPASCRRACRPNVAAPCRCASRSSRRPGSRWRWASDPTTHPGFCKGERCHRCSALTWMVREAHCYTTTTQHTNQPDELMI